MLYVKIELWPHGLTTQKQILFEGGIANDGTGTKTTGNYTFAFANCKSHRAKKGEVRNFKRLNKSSLELLYLCLKQIFHKGD